MNQGLLLDPPVESALAEWIESGQYVEPSHSNVVEVDSPDGTYLLRVQIDDPVDGYLIELFHGETRLARTVVTDRDRAVSMAVETVGAADELRELDRREEGLEPREVTDAEGEQEPPPVPDEWDTRADKWTDQIRAAYEKADVEQSKGTLVRKTIDGRDYYYIQWREGDRVMSQYVAPVVPSNS